MTRILHLTVRARSGGAATIAESLRCRFESADDCETRLFYGYETGGRRDLAWEGDHTNALAAPIEWKLGLNRALFPIVGADLLQGSRRKALSDAWRWSDVVHLHVIHSYWLPLGTLVDLQSQWPKRVIWTMHDEWALTGRCAFTNGCQQWRSGCPSCPDLRLYPGALIDRAKHHSPDRRRDISLILNGNVMVAVAAWQQKALLDWYPDIDIRLIRNGVENSVDEQQPDLRRRHCGLVVGADLASTVKFDWELLRAAASRVSLDLVGRNPPDGPNFRPLGELPRSAVASIYGQYDFLAFTSSVDIAPMVILESLMQGTPVVAVASAASNELIGMVGGRTVSRAEFCQAVSDPLQVYPQVSRSELRNAARQVFGATQMFAEYLALYRGVSA